MLDENEIRFLLYTLHFYEIIQEIELKQKIRQNLTNQLKKLVLLTEIHLGHPIRIIYCDSDSIFTEDIFLLTDKK